MSKPSDAESRRANRRVPIEVEGYLRISKDFRVPCTIRNISEGGAMLILGLSFDVPKRFVLVVEGNVQIERKCVVQWHRGFKAGVRFIRQRWKRNVKPEDPDEAAGEEKTTAVAA